MTNPIHPSLSQPILLMGAERSLAITNFTAIAALLGGGGIHWITVGAALFLATVVHWILVQAAKRDPQMSRVFLRHHFMYRAVYSARANPYAPLPRLRPAVPSVREIRG